MYIMCIVCICVHLSIYPSIHLSIYRSIYRSIHTRTHARTHTHTHTHTQALWVLRAALSRLTDAEPVSLSTGAAAGSRVDGPPRGEAQPSAKTKNAATKHAALGAGPAAYCTEGDRERESTAATVAQAYLNVIGQVSHVLLLCPV